MKQIDFIVKK